MSHYSIFVPVEKGKGDYGTDCLCVFDGLASKQAIERIAKSYAKEFRIPVQVFKGKRTGRFDFVTAP
jgi:hypothetical protein